jgi:hypothetical protein
MKTTFEIGQHVRVVRDIDLGPHSIIGRGERGRVVGVDEDGSPHIEWVKVHPGIARLGQLLLSPSRGRRHCRAPALRREGKDAAPDRQACRRGQPHFEDDRRLAHGRGGGVG